MSNQKHKRPRLPISDADNSVMHNSVLDNKSDVRLMKQQQESKKFDGEIRNYVEISQEYLCQTRSCTSISGMFPGVFMFPGVMQKVTFKDYGDSKSAEAELECYNKLENTNFFVQMIQKPEPPQRLLAVFEPHKENIFLHLQDYDNDLLCPEYSRQFLSAVNNLQQKGLVLKFSENPNHIALTSNKMLKICNLEDAKQTTCVEEIQKNVTECAAILHQILENCEVYNLSNNGNELEWILQRRNLMFLIELLRENKMTLSDSLKTPAFYSSSERSLLFLNFCKWVERSREGLVQKPNLLRFLRTNETFKYWKSKLNKRVKKELDDENPKIEDNALGLIRTVRNKLSHQDDRDKRGAWNNISNDITISEWAARFPALITFVHQLKCAAEGCGDDFRKYEETTQLIIYHSLKLLDHQTEKILKYYSTHDFYANLLSKFTFTAF